MLKIEELKFDKNGLIPAIVIDSVSKKVLTLAYMNEESLKITMEKNLTCFYSRSRKELWLKGETSGNYQHVVSITADCDRDALVVSVRPDGPACHKGTTSCFNDLVYLAENEKDFSFEELMELIIGRKTDKKEGSYTTYLFEKGRDKILKKVGEESTEVIIAGKADDKPETVYEIADLIYHLFVLMADMGITQADIFNELSTRHVIDKTGKNDLMEKCDFHVHSTFSDGNDEAEEIIKTAVNMGLSAIGISDHSYTPFDAGYSLHEKNVPKYLAEIKRLKEKYQGVIKVYCGVELDLFSSLDLTPYDYVIGSSHYFKRGDNYYSIDNGKEVFENTIKSAFDGDYIKAAEEYFNNVSKFADIKEVKIIGHFDLVSKYNEIGKYFDENDSRYVSAYKKAAEKLVSAGKTFEINTGAFRKKLRSEPYPSKNIRQFIKSLGGKFILSSDSHRKEDLTFGFDIFDKEL